MANCLQHILTEGTAMSGRATTAPRHGDARWHAIAPTAVRPIFVGSNGTGASFALGTATKPYHQRPKEKLL